MRLAFLVCFVVLINGSTLSQSATCLNTLDSLLKTPSGTIAKEKLKELRPCIYELQTKGFNLAEQKCKYDSARIAIEGALVVWKHINDTLNQANLLKFIGYLNGRLGKFQLAKTQIHDAIQLFKYKKDEFGLAVSQFDLAQVYEYENKIDSAIDLSQKSLAFWKIKNVAGRIVILNNHLINLYTKHHTDASKVMTIIKENEQYLAQEKIYYLQQLDFYFVSYKYFQKVKDRVNKSKYLTLYTDRIAGIEKDQGERLFSLYDERNCR